MQGRRFEPSPVLNSQTGEVASSDRWTGSIDMEDRMSNLRKKLRVGNFVSAVLLCPVIYAAPALANSTTSAAFTVATCRSAMDDLGKIDAMAQERNWSAAPDDFATAQNNLVKIRSAWKVTQGEDQFVVATGLSQIAGNIPAGNLCMVMFPGMKVQRDEFFNALSSAMELKPTGNMTFPQGRLEIFEIEGDGPTKLIAELMSQNDGIVVMASLASIHVPTSPQPAASQVDGAVRSFWALDASTVYVLGTDGKLWREFDTWNNALKPRVSVDRNVNAFQALDVTTVFVLGTDSTLWREFGTWNNTRRPRNFVDGNVQAFKALDINIVYVLGTDGKLWREFGAWDSTQQPRQNVDGHVRAFQPLDASIVYVLGNDGKLWREFGAWSNVLQPRQNVDGSVAAFQALDATTVYVLGNNGNLWREFGSWNNAEQPRVHVDGNVKAFQALDANIVYVLGSDGNLWREQGTMQTRTRVASNVVAFQAVDDNTVYVLHPDEMLFRVRALRAGQIAE
jgi:hypothetical protein